MAVRPPTERDISRAARRQRSSGVLAFKLIPLLKIQALACTVVLTLDSRRHCLDSRRHLARGHCRHATHFRRSDGRLLARFEVVYVFGKTVYLARPQILKVLKYIWVEWVEPRTTHSNSVRIQHGSGSRKTTERIARSISRSRSFKSLSVVTMSFGKVLCVEV
tara:strand:+ start:116 stop:604 length:489 start_codon:yes stop_codon:yes gene_type:complete